MDVIVNTNNATEAELGRTARDMAEDLIAVNWHISSLVIRNRQTNAVVSSWSEAEE